MNISIKQNRALLSSRKKEGFKSNNRDGIYTVENSKKIILEFKTISRNELNKIKTKIQSRAERSRKKELLYYATLFGMATILVILFLKTT